MNGPVNHIGSPKEFRESWIGFVHDLQQRICHEIEIVDGKATFMEDIWKRDFGEGGGGKTKVLSKGQVFEKAGVNTSVVYGLMTESMKQQLKVDGIKWFACGLSLVFHPQNPFVPTIHANWRYFELYNESGKIIDRWFGGGTDLTPYYLFEEDVIHFHKTLKDTLDPFGTELYPTYKKGCDEYFSNSHRNNEMRGIGGVFYDHLHIKNEEDAQRLFQFQKANGNAFLNTYLPIVDKRRNTPYGKTEMDWQEIRRGRYVEFNLLHDRGTIFGLRTNGRTESILMSLPPRARWEYNYQPTEGSEEDKLLQACLHPREWI